MPQAPIRSFPPVRTPHATVRQIEFEASMTSPHGYIQTLDAFSVELVDDPAPYTGLLPNQENIRQSWLAFVCTVQVSEAFMSPLPNHMLVQ